MQGTVTNTLETLVKHREEVIAFVRKELMDSGMNKLEASQEVSHIYFFRFTDTEGMYRCINSDFDKRLIRAIITHDFKGLKQNDPDFVPKSRQFGGRNG